MSLLLRDHDFQIAYGPNDDGLNRFYVPALSRSVSYDRSAGFFSSSALAVAAAGVARLLANNGRMRLLVGAQLSEDDVAALHGGADLAEVVAQRMTSGLEEMIDAIARQRLEVLAWMIQQGTLEVRVVLPKGPDGHPLPAAMCHDYYHPKTGIFTDADGNQVAFSGSVNESQQAWQHNYEQFMVYTSWNPPLLPYISQIRRAFQELWDGTQPDWLAIAVPEAVRQHLLRYSPDHPPVRDPLEKEPLSVQPSVPELPSADRRERLMFQFVRDAPFLPNGHRLGQVASTVRLWPHQEAVVRKVVGTYPRSYLLCDEVGLGKTLEGGGIVKQLMLTGQVRRCLILAPKSVCRQWQEELYEKFLLNVPIYDGGVFTDYFQRDLPCRSENPWNVPVIIASSQLAKRRDRAPELYRADPWDLVLVDEAHHARRKDFLSGQYRRNRLLSLLRGPQEDPRDPGLAGRAKCLILITATPMQVDAREVWDLLTVLGLGGRWGAADDNFVRFFNQIRSGADADWPFVLLMVRDYLDHGGTIDPTFAQEALKRVGLVAWDTIRGLPYRDKPKSPIGQLNEAEQAMLLEFARRHTPLADYTFRNTRSLLREYQKRGLLGKDRVPYRKPELRWIPMRQDERELYERIEEYITDFYRKYEEERKGLGFVMTVYRKRLTSSFYAVTKSLERRLRFLRGDPGVGPAGGLTEEDFEEEDLDTDALEDQPQADRSLYREEIAYVEDFLSQLRPLDVDSKVEQLLEDLAELLRKRETIIIFTLYADTMDYLREKLRAVYGPAVACYSGRGGEIWDGQGWRRVSKDDIKRDFKEEKIKILLGTDALSEGLNLQTCGMMINYDMPWNPMRVEQRIGRIDRIGQRYDEVWISNYFYEDTVESNVYRALENRINWFETVVGDLQPILAHVARAIKSAAMESRQDRGRVLAQEIEIIKREIDEKQVASLNLDEYVAVEVERASDEAPPLTQSDIERLLLQATAMQGRFEPHPNLAGAYHLWNEGVAVPVTFDPRLFDQRPSTLHLLSYHEELFHQLLDSIPPPEDGDWPPGIIRLESKDPQQVAYYQAVPSGVVPITQIRTLEATLNEEVQPLTSEQTAAAREAFDARCEALRQRDRDLQEMHMRGEKDALYEKGRHLLLQATYIDLAMAQHQELFDKAPNLAGFSEEAVGALKRHGYPFAPLLRLIGSVDIQPSPSDPGWVKVQDASRESLQRQFEAIKKPIDELLHKLSLYSAKK